MIERGSSLYKFRLSVMSVFTKCAFEIHAHGALTIFGEQGMLAHTLLLIPTLIQIVL